jgi:excisionase family DNA binding protein
MSSAELEQMIRRVVREERGAPQERAVELITIAQAAAAVSLGVTKIRQWLKDGTLKRYGEGRCVRVSRHQLLEVMANPKQKAAPVSADDVAAAALRRLY